MGRSPTWQVILAKRLLSGGHPVADGWDRFSSRRWKTNIQTLHGALAKVEQLRGVSYDLKDSGKHEVGVIAEEAGPSCRKWSVMRRTVKTLAAWTAAA